ncbi:uncharacterized protein [Pyrus communis]|uniref:uncharacterized protein n=1 Tax=Pyrus communis TaxID=23211 RepID=UPI0035C05E4D
MGEFVDLTLIVCLVGVQVGAARVLCNRICLVAASIGELRHSISYILLEQLELNEDLFVATVNLLTSAALHQPAFLVAVLPTKVNKDVQLSNGGGVKLPTNDFESGKASVVNCNPRLLLNVLNFLRRCGKVLKLKICPSDTSAKSAILEIIAHSMFLHKKLLHAESFVKQLPESQDRIQNTVRSEKSKAADLEAILSAWCESSVLGNLIKSLTNCEYDPELFLRAKVAASVITARVMVNLSVGDAGSLSMSLVQKSSNMSNKLRSHPAFSELLAQYSQHGYSAGKEPNYLILSDLYYHLQGQLEGPEISAGPFKELSQFLIESNIFQTYQHKDDGDLFVTRRDTYLFDLKCSLETKRTVRQIPDQLVFSCIDHICLSFHNTVESLAPVPSASEDIFHFLAAQAESLLYFMMFWLKALSDFRALVTRPSVMGVDTVVKLLLMLLLSAVEFSCHKLHLVGARDIVSVEDMAKISNVSLGLLPVIATAEHGILSLTTMDLILRNFLTPNTWFPIIENHLQLQHVILKLQNKNFLESVPVIMKFFMTLARVRQGAEMLINYGFLSSLRFLNSSSSSEKLEKPEQIWGLGLAVITAMVESLGDSSACSNLVENVIPYFFSEKDYMISYYLSAPDFPSDDHDKKRPWAQQRQTSLTDLKETEHTLMLMCVLAKYWNSWVKSMKELDSQLREKSIHLLAFISRGTQRLGEPSSLIAPLLCPSVLKEEFDGWKKPSFINSKSRWFALSALSCVSKPKFSTIPTTSTALVIKTQATVNGSHISLSYFSDSIALQIYRITFLLLKFLSLQAEGAARREEEVGFVDLDHFPELPMPEILHGLQDQAITIVTELCVVNRSNEIQIEVQSICCLLLQIMEMALHSELCVLQICGIRPVMGRVEDFSKEVKHLVKATERHAFLKPSAKSLKQIISVIYPGLLQADEFL